MMPLIYTIVGLEDRHIPFDLAEDSNITWHAHLIKYYLKIKGSNLYVYKHVCVYKCA